MTLEHEYAILGGYNRTKVGRYITHIASVVSGGLVFLLLTAVDVAKRFGISVNVPPVIMSLLGASMIYAALYWIFDRYAWRVGFMARLLKVPHLAGTWICEGLSQDKNPPLQWNGSVTIVQSWDKIRIHLSTSQSASYSVAAALLDETPTGYRLMYHYKNEPRAGEPADLTAHHGFADLIFAPDGQTASGGYFNGRGRNTFGKMNLTKDAA